MKTNSIIKNNLVEASEILSLVMNDSAMLQNIEQAAITMVSAIKETGKIIACGNGGSMSDAMHFSEELTGKFREERNPIPAIAISDPAYITCVANDYGFREVFSRFVQAHGKKNDVLLAISTSGNSENIIRAIKTAKEKGMKVIALTGNDGGKIKKLADIEIRVPHKGYSDRIQEIHIKIIHIWIQFIETKLF